MTVHENVKTNRKSRHKTKPSERNNSASRSQSSRFHRPVSVTTCGNFSGLRGSPRSRKSSWTSSASGWPGIRTAWSCPGSSCRSTLRSRCRLGQRRRSVDRPAPGQQPRQAPRAHARVRAGDRWRALVRRFRPAPAGCRSTLCRSSFRPRSGAPDRMPTPALLATVSNPSDPFSHHPAIWQLRVGAGEAVLFAFDLAKSVSRLRHGDPDLADMPNEIFDRITRPSDLFRGQLDPRQATVPQADILTAVLGRAVESLIPQPRLWYYPVAVAAERAAANQRRRLVDDRAVRDDARRAQAVRRPMHLLRGRPQPAHDRSHGPLGAGRACLFGTSLDEDRRRRPSADRRIAAILGAGDGAGERGATQGAVRAPGQHHPQPRDPLGGLHGSRASCTPSSGFGARRTTSRWVRSSPAT